jgi:hypothetical protein
MNKTSLSSQSSSYQDDSTINSANLNDVFGHNNSLQELSLINKESEGKDDIEFSNSENEIVEEEEKESMAPMNEVEDHENTVDSISLFRWQKDGGMKNIKISNNPIQRQYFRCSRWNKPDKDYGCKARMTQEYNYQNEMINQYTNNENHNHALPSKVRLAPEVVADIKQRLLHKQKVADIHKDIVNGSDCSNPSKIASRKQIHNMAAYLKRSLLPTGDAIQNMITLYGHKFIREIRVFPAIHILMMAPEAATLLQEYGKILYIDGTFNICEGKLVLTTLMATVNGIGLPCAWILSNSRTQQSYEKMLRIIKEELTENRLEPKAILCDFEGALRNSCANIFQEALICGDAFHFVQACTRWMKQNGGCEFIDELVITLRILWASNSTMHFAENLASFEKIWAHKHAPFLAYFKRMWLQIYPPASWASFGRGKNVPSGDQILEGYHNRLQSIVLSHKNEAVDHVVHLLWQEWQYQYKIITTPHLLKERQKEMQDRKKYDKRITLANYIDKTQALTIQNYTGSINNNTTALIQNNLKENNHLNTSQTIEEFFGDTDTSKIIEETIISSENVLLLSSSEGKCSCGHAKKNQQCTHKKCLVCCSNIPQPCLVTSHKNAKMKKFVNPFIEIIEAAMSNKEPIWIKYNGGTDPGSVRSIEPISWKNKPLRFEAICQQSGIIKTFRLDRIEECSDKPLNKIL